MIICLLVRGHKCLYHEMKQLCATSHHGTFLYPPPENALSSGQAPPRDLSSMKLMQAMLNGCTKTVAKLMELNFVIINIRSFTRTDDDL
uniref:Uncharacterized protein n=1 Tax=Rhipicephalus zambeziensis TaxID=60191 RepID=A0A224YCW7_9ACAR